jgi:hypothetical protein
MTKPLYFTRERIIRIHNRGSTITKERIAYLKIGIQYLTNRELNENQYPTGEKLYLAQDINAYFINVKNRIAICHLMTMG